LQYVIGHTLFADLKIKCDARALIPRPETEELVYKILERIEHFPNNAKILDICTGSGCIALALKKHWSSAQVSALDISEEALQLAKENAIDLKLAVGFLLADALQLAENEDLFHEKWNIIVSNPPYIPNKDKALMHKNVLDHEPGLALFVDDYEPIVFYEKIIAFAKNQLSTNGVLAFELHEGFANDVAQCCSQNAFSAVEIFNDLQGKPRMLLAQF
jgi:release factor glutamine methyltransferase